jgi:tRNA modification GTPase
MDDTICAIATPPGEGGIGILRLSGLQALDIAARVVRLRSGQALAAASSRHLHFVDLIETPASLPEGARSVTSATPFDEGFVVLMRAPHSYTREDVVEIHCHGGMLVLRRLCEGLLRGGARLAHPGEFTKRAFLNGRLDLTQAEAVLDTIRAKTDAALRAAQQQLRGSLSSQANALRERLLALLARVEAAIDFVDEDIRLIDSDEILSATKEMDARIARWLATAARGRILREGVSTAIVGRPNVGKSSLLNALAERDRAIVTDIPGTTRDVLEESVAVEGISLRLLDTAGLRDTSDLIEREGVRRTLAAIKEAELILHVVDASCPLHQTDRSLWHELDGRRVIMVLNKTDLSIQLAQPELERLLRESGLQAMPIVRVSALTGLGLEDLRKSIVSRWAPSSLETNESAAVTRLRHAEALTRARVALQHAQQAVADAAPPECLAMDLRAASDALGELTGAITTEEVLDRIFSEFCIGK